MNLADVVTEFGAYYQDRGQNMNDIHQKLRRGFVTGQAFTTVLTDDTVWHASKAVSTRIVQPFQKGFTPTGAVTFSPVAIQSFHMKGDVSETPDDLEATWLGFLSDNDVKRTEWPFVRWLMEKIVIPQINQDIELNEIGRGAYVAPTAGTPGPAGTAMNGILTTLNTHITAGRITPIALGAIPTADNDVVEYFEEFHKSLDLAYRNVPMTVYTSENAELAFLRGYGNKYGNRTTTTAAEETSLKVKHTNLTVKGIPSLNLKANGTPNDRFFCTPKENAIMLQKKFENKGKFDLQAFERVIKLLTDWWMGVGFIIPEIVFVNDGAA
ncbi:hypothetical protein SAMN05216327_101208 [Dyadobacter sp. SG02]|uniref:hypothetical protein n=1 Tax=Dyadobacter sp. SG02 TaxID=1855291 RepID=UPI0008CDD06F|nr:hypothetical protein [Dyadobacter sp. SG02]SEI39563.1 hypothetical protein SAMN05216327_101208 [Dyadobacter sp. SG02]